MNVRLESYLKRATNGVPRRQRTEIQAELRANIDLRATELELLGLTHAEGVNRALEEMGAPKLIRHGMAWVYTAPRAVRWAFSAMLTAFCCVAPLNPLTVHVQASAVTDASGKLKGINLETTSFSTALEAAGIPLNDAGLDSGAVWSSNRLGQRFTTARSWNEATRYRLDHPTPSALNLELTDALRALCALSARVTLESPSSSVVFRVTWQGSTSRIALNLEPVDALEFHEGVGRNLGQPCQR
jgi:hypothetical protein